MKVSVIKTEGLERQMTVEVPADNVEDAIKARLKKLARDAKLPGFRPGKVPFKIIEQKYGNSVRQEVQGELLRKSFSDAINQEALRPAGVPNIEPKQLEQGQSLEYTATFDVYPDISPVSLEGARFSKPVISVSDNNVNNMLESIRKQYAEWEEKTGKAEEGDRLLIDFHGTINGDEFDGNKAENFQLIIGSNRLIKGFEQNLIGHQAGDNISFDVSFPEDYQTKELAGKPVKFSVTLKSIEKPILPELDEEFTKRLGIQDGGLDALKETVIKNMTAEAERVARDKIRTEVLDALLASSQIELPKSLLESEIDRMAAAEVSRAGAHAGQDELDSETFREKFMEPARRKVSLGLLEAEIIRQNKLTADPEKVKAALQGIAVGYEDPQAIIKWYLEDRARLSQIEAYVLEEEVVDILLKQAEITEEACSYDEIMGFA